MLKDDDSNDRKISFDGFFQFSFKLVLPLNVCTFLYSFKERNELMR